MESFVPLAPTHNRTGKILFGALTGVLAWLLVLILHQVGLLEPFELKTYDHLCRLNTSTLRAPEAIALVVVDQGSLDHASKELGVNWPWPRQMYFPIVQFSTLAGARAIVIDVLYTEPSAYGVADDQLLAEALENSGRVMLPIFLTRDDLPQENWVVELLDRIALPLENRSRLLLPTYPSAKTPIRVLAESSAGMGNVELPPDSDGIYRRLPLVFRQGDRWIPNLGLAAVLYLERPGSLVLEGNGLRLGTKTAPLDRQGNFLLNFYGEGGEYPRYSASKILQSFVALQSGGKPIYKPEVFKDKIVFVGFTAPGLFDLKPTPVSSVYPGVAVHATLAANLLQQDFRTRIQSPLALTLAAGAAIITGVTVMLLVKIWQLGLLTLSCVLGLGLFVGISFRQNLWVDGVLLTTNLGLSFALSTAFSYATEGRQRRQIKRMFSHYMSDLLIQDLINNPDKLRLGGERRVLTVFFSDLAGFTTLSEKLTPEEVVALLNRYLTAMTDIILTSGGIIDKYEGDAIMAFWGAPIPQNDHATRACIAALDNQSRLADLRREFIEMGLPPVYARIGINTGEMIIGNMGSTQRFDFTVMGDNVNLASRLEGAGKYYGTRIIISEETYRQASDRVEVRELDILQVKGKKVPVKVYELLAKKGDLDESTRQVRDLFAVGLAQYRKQKWPAAIDYFQKVLAVAPEDGPARTFLERSEKFRETPPPPSWDGVYQLTSK